MFDFLMDMGNIAERRVAVYEEDDLFVSTVRVSDSTQPFETAVEHPNYNDGKLVIVEQYDTKAEAEAGHEKWLAEMTADVLPVTLTDVSGSGVAQLCDAFGDEDWRTMPSSESQ